MARCRVVAATRRLAAIMFTDMVGFTASTQTDEASALKLLREQERLVRPLLKTHKGREIKSTGDGFLVEFDSALRAIQCAIDIHRHLRERNSKPGCTPIRLRIGIHLGDVEERAGDIFGDSVNLAARIHPLAEPGGICISESVFIQVRNKIPNRCEKLESKSLKGVMFPMDVYRVHLAWAPGVPSSTGTGPSGLDKSRIAVLPFVSMSPDPNDEYFADGLTEELIASLSLVRGLKVIARTSAMSYKNKEKHVSEIGKELGVGTVVEGSVRKAANRIRVTVQVIDVATEEHLWASQYDDRLDDIFAVQSDIATKVAGSLPSNLAVATPPLPFPKETPDVQAYMYFLQGQALVYRRDEESVRQALRFFEQAVERDPSFARAYAATARSYLALCLANVIPLSEAAKHARTALEKARSISPDLAEAHATLASLSYTVDDPIEAVEKELKTALDLNPNLADAWVSLGLVEASKGDARSWVSHCELAYQLDPLSHATIRWLGLAYFYAGRGEDALEHWKRTIHLDPIDTYRQLTDYYLSKGDLENADAMVKELERIAPTNPFAYLNRGHLAALRGDKTTAMEMIAKLEPTREAGYIRSIYAGYIYLALGDVDKFFEYMFSAAKDHTLDDKDMMYSPLFAEVRKDPRMEQLLTPFGRRLPTAV